MPEYRRAKIKGGTYFFTLVTYRRQKLFLFSENIALFLNSLNHIKRYHPFKLHAYCILPDHIHMIWELPEDDDDYANRISQIKGRFSKAYISNNGDRSDKSISRYKRRETSIWQRRYWEHYIRDEDDFQVHFDYIHFNPVKHRLVDRVLDWPYSSFQECVENDIYSPDWGGMMENENEKINFGE